MDESGQSGEKALRVEGHGCVFGGQVVFGYPPETETQVQFRVSTKSGELQPFLCVSSFSSRWAFFASVKSSLMGLHITRSIASFTRL